MKMSNSVKLRTMALVGTDVSEETIACVIKVTRIGELRKTLAVTSKFLLIVLRLLVVANVAPSSPNLVTLIMEGIRCPKHRFLQ
jgi:hypothetical protein